MYSNAVTYIISSAISFVSLEQDILFVFFFVIKTKNYAIRMGIFRGKERGRGDQAKGKRLVILPNLVRIMKKMGAQIVPLSL